MKVGMIAPPWVPVPPVGYGGTEGVVDSLARGLRDLGHDVVLFTTADSTCPVERRWVYDEAVEPMGCSLVECRHVQAAYDGLADCDIIHDHTTIGPIWAAASKPRIPVVTTIHSSFNQATRPVLAHVGQWLMLNTISQNQRDSAPEVPVAAVIHHGINPDDHTVGDGSGGYAFFIGRCAPEKGAHDAIEIARRAGIPLRIAAKMRAPEEYDYFHDMIEPHIGPGVEFMGEISPQERDRQLAGAVALLNPITWSEPFGLVMIEAMASGTPVISYPYGAAPEIVTSGLTGFLVGGVAQAVDALRLIDVIDRRACRAEVEGRFSSMRMTTDYVTFYRRAMGFPKPRDIDLTGQGVVLTDVARRGAVMR